MNDKVRIETAHSELGPSASSRWLKCPGSVLACRELPNVTSVYAAEGNAAHELSEWVRNERKPAQHWRGTIIQVADYEFKVERAMIAGVNSFVKYVEQLPGRALYEVRVNYPQWVPGGFGTLDDARLQDWICFITDLKYGKGVQVFALNNFQLMMYALGLYHDWKHLYEFRRFVLAIHQPRMDHVETFEIDLTTLLDWAENVVKPIAEIALKPGASFVAGPHCQFCPARFNCATKARYDSKEDDFDDLDVNKDTAIEVTDFDEF